MVRGIKRHIKELNKITSLQGMISYYIAYYKDKQNYLNIKIKKIKKNKYYLFFLFFKYLIFNDLINLYYKSIYYKYQINLYLKKKELRFYYIFHYIILKGNYLYYFLIHYTLDVNEYDEGPTDDDYRQYVAHKSIYIRHNINKYIYYYCNYLIIYIYMIKVQYFKEIFMYYNKLYYYNEKYLFKRYYLYKEFIIKIDYLSYFLYRKYLPYFRLFKYNEYLKNSKLFLKYPKLKWFLYIYYLRYQLKYNIFKKSIYIKCLKIYAIDFFNNNNYKHRKRKWLNDYNKTYRQTSRYIKYNKLNYYNYNSYIYIKKQNFILFLKKNILLKKFIKFYKFFFKTYICYLHHKVFRKYTLKLYKFRKLKPIHLSVVYLRLYLTGFNTASFLFKFLFKNLNFSFFCKIYTINFSFLSYFFLENNIYIKYFLKKNILLYKIKSLIIASYINDYYIHLEKSFKKLPHRRLSFYKPDILKRWRINYIKFMKKHKNKKIAFLFLKLYFKNKRIIGNFEKRGIINKGKTTVDNINFNNAFYKIWYKLFFWNFIIFQDIINLIYNKQDLILMFSNYKYTLELISWIIIFEYYLPNNWNIYNNRFQLLVKRIKIQNIIIDYFNKYINNLLIIIYNKKRSNIISSTYIYWFLRDFFFNIILKKNNINNRFLNNYISQKNINNYNIKFKYCMFMRWQIKQHWSYRKYWLYYRQWWHLFYIE